MQTILSAMQNNYNSYYYANFQTNQIDFYKKQLIITFV